MATGFWWTADTDQAHGQVVGVFDSLSENQSQRTEANLRHARLYGGSDLLGFGAGQYTRSRSSALAPLGLNVIQSMADAVTSKIAKNKPKPTFLTTGGDYSLQRKAKLLDKFCQGVFHATGLYGLASRVFLDAVVFGTGFLKIYELDGEIACERVFPDEIAVDDAEAIYGEPRQMFQRKFISREQLIALYPDHRAAIEECEAEDTDWARAQGLVSMVSVVEAWHLPSQGAKKADGRHVIAIGTATLLDEAWERDSFPFAVLRWSERLLGYFGQGLAEQLLGLQLEINKLLKTIQLAQHLCSVPRYLVAAGSKVAKAHLSNEVGGIITYQGTAPQIQVSPAMAPEVYQHLDRLYQRAYEIAGISQLSAQSKKPSGLDSGKALREFNDIESERFVIVGQAYEQFFLDAAEQMIELARTVHERDGSFETVAHDKRGVERIKWGEVGLPRDEYVMQVFPTSSLPTSPAGRMQTVQELLGAGMVDADTAIELLDFPDTERAQSLRFAHRDVVRRAVEEMIERGRYESPEPYMNLEFCLSYTQQAYLRARLDGVPEERLDLLRQYMQQAQDLIDMAQPAPPQPAPPEAMPAAPPAEMPAEMPMPDPGVPIQ